MKPWEYKPKPRSLLSVGDKATAEFPQLENLADWQGRLKELRVEHPNGIILNAQPHHIRNAAERHLWGVIYTPDCYLLLSWGDVPRYALMDKRNLETGELLIAEQVAA